MSQEEHKKARLLFRSNETTQETFNSPRLLSYSNEMFQKCLFAVSSKALLEPTYFDFSTRFRSLFPINTFYRQLKM
jgi:hypothetical protein